MAGGSQHANCGDAVSSPIGLDALRETGSCRKKEAAVGLPPPLLLAGYCGLVLTAASSDALISPLPSASAWVKVDAAASALAPFALAQAENSA